MSNQDKQQKKVDINQSEFQFQEEQPPVQKSEEIQQYSDHHQSANQKNQSQPQRQQQQGQPNQPLVQPQQHYNFDEPVAEEISSISNKSSQKAKNVGNDQQSELHMKNQQQQFIQRSNQAQEQPDIQYPSLSNQFDSSQLKGPQPSIKQSTQNKIQSQQAKSLQNVQQKQNKQKQKKQQHSEHQIIKDNILDNKALIQLAENQEVTEIKLIKSQRNQKPIQIKFLQYKVEYFLKIQTQIFVVQVNPQEDIQPYVINRRFSDFLFLFESITINHLGYILYPFPQKNLDTFIKLKLNFSIENEGQKIQLIQQRMIQLQKFTNFILHHRQLRNSDEIQIFLSKDQIFQKDRKRIQSFVEEYKNLESHSNLKNIVDKGFNFITSYLRKSSGQEKQKTHTISKRELQFGIYLENVQTYIDKISTMLDILQQLLKIQKDFTQFVDIETDIDLLLKLCAKHTSGKQYAKFLSKWIENQILQHLFFRLRDLKQIQSQLLYRIQLQQIIKDISGKSENKEQQAKLKRRISRFESNFRQSWTDFFSQFKKSYEKYTTIFKQAWSDYQKKMTNIWKEQ